MKTQTMLALLAVLGSASVLAQGQTGVGNTYHSRDPLVCNSMKDPARGAPSPSQARDYILCANEKIMGSGLLLYENVQAEVGKSRPFSARADSGAGEIDPSQPVYPVRGTWDAYTCWEPTHNGTVGKNCNMRKATPFAGACYRTTFGDWSCRVRNTSWDLSDSKAGVPPPRLGEATLCSVPPGFATRTHPATDATGCCYGRDEGAKSRFEDAAGGVYGFPGPKGGAWKTGLFLHQASVSLYPSGRGSFFNERDHL